MRRNVSIGVYVFGLGTMAAGILDFIWGEFEAGHQPIQAFGDHIPGREIFAYLAATWLVAAGLAILWRRTASVGALVSAVIYFIFAVFWLPRFYTVPQVFGFRISVFLGVLGGVAQQLILVAAAAIVYVTLATRGSLWPQRIFLVARWTFGLSSVNFGINHLTALKVVAPMVPKWMPLGGEFWTVLSGIAFILAGFAILSGILDVWASRLLAFMLLIFNALVLVPAVFAHPHAHIAWGSNAYNLAAAGAVYIFAESIANRSLAQEHEITSQLVEVS
jgi:hypothetical protein